MSVEGSEDPSSNLLTEPLMPDRKGNVPGGKPQSLSVERRKISQKIMASHAQELAEAGFFQRISLYWKIRKEVGRELERMEPRGHN
jgi:hypothetical protein